MLFKLIISLIIIGCSWMIGMIYANTYIERSKLLASMLSTMQMLETEIVYSGTPLPELLQKIAKKSRREIAKIFLLTAEILNRKEGYLFNEAWEQAVKTETKNTSFTKEDIDLLISLGKNLGISDSKDQIKHIHLTMEEIKRSYELSIIEQNKNVRLCRNFGFLIGITIVIIFF
ncbi:stage III sporulation protein AB [Anaerovirgula multivorans]|uniref:Stage III sporulation protein AB n=1 Tax=Anaerovirgula multivorans TaxID=312168 RepID=A0A238ZUK8_9FIRM|nr:stage III sporulation protein SpoIIIAB [Anaerovirgula multivorans]SNR86711.1 stage III sporulation protein AB [Anaerovirgula multivorans]